MLTANAPSDAIRAMRGTIMRAYQVKNLAGRALRVDDERYAIMAKNPGKPNVDEVSAMLRTMLKDRLKLAGTSSRARSRCMR
jgi:uncharacterized protein (TIGR03435 family)